MANKILRDGLNITDATILIDWVAGWMVTGITIDSKSPEDLVSVIWGLVRRRKAETNEWSADNVMLYNDLADLIRLKAWVKFNIEISMVNPNNTAETQKILISNCTVNASTISIQEASTYKMSWTCEWVSLV